MSSGRPVRPVFFAGPVRGGARPSRRAALLRLIPLSPIEN